MGKVISHSLFSEFDVSLFQSGKHYRLYEKFGSHPMTVDGVSGTYFAVWAPSAKSVSVIGDFNFWNDKQHPLMVRWDASGIWELIRVLLVLSHAFLNRQYGERFSAMPNRIFRGDLSELGYFCKLTYPVFCRS